eukprot:CAMPEP_0170516818 /NCGR_PEP_ID=MMETSP0209-20121228/2950_1 /TAXON_ID=665100 ORGANISM="Litonotus pictus, Strain P1" /NCGR_SAMPLE_ID=MMETSP0209 /ASSEMBLY_ACC=CAM_ASM_000301 /LENGTH=565 /DNA_ID=CAMNT_0010801861 /DNA_START=426 /DNA_END=2123 /DNA_ORIENTATION=+
MNTQSRITYKFKAQENNGENNYVPYTSKLKPNPKDVAQSMNHTHLIPPKEPGDTWQEWWSIQSHEFKNYKRHPPLTLPNGTTIEIMTLDSNRMRFNPAFNCTTDDSKPVNNITFWVRMNNIHIYYSSTKTDLNVLGSIDWEDTVDIVEVTKYYNNIKYFCFEINDKFNKNWRLCNTNSTITRLWVCRISNILKMPLDPKCISPIRSSKIETKDVDEIQPEVIIPLPSKFCNENWSYRHLGQDWDCLCKEGYEQSPIDLPSKSGAIDSPVKPFFEYNEIGPKDDFSTLDKEMDRGDNMMIKNDNHLVIYNYKFGKVVTLDGAVYNAEEITFHTPSNHRINGKQYPLEISIIHYGVSKGDIAKQIVLSFLFEKKAGVYNQFLDDIDFYNLPNMINKKRDLKNTVFIPKIFYNFNGINDDQVISMKPFSFYTYQGSLPFPPCSENSINFVASEPLQIGSSALQLFQEALRMPDMVQNEGSSFNVIVSDWLPVSNREVQPLNGRPVFYYDHTKYCPFRSPPPVVKPFGHYEKMKRDLTNYFYVNGNKPSGIPGAHVVPEEEVNGSKDHM